MGRIGSLTEKGEVHWRKRWAKGTACCYVAIQTPQGSLLQIEAPLTEEQMKTILKMVGLAPKHAGEVPEADMLAEGWKTDD